MRRRLLALAALGLVFAGPAAPAAVTPAVSASVAVDVSCFGDCGSFVADFARTADGGAGAASASASFEGVHAQTHSSADEAVGALTVDAAASLTVPPGAAGNVNVTPTATIDDTITLSGPATVTVHGAIAADIVSDSSSDYVLGKVLIAGTEAATEEYDGTASGARSFSADVTLPAGTSDFEATLSAHIDLRPSDGETLGASVKQSTMTFAIEVPAGITASSGSGRLPLSAGPATTPSLRIADVDKPEGDSGTTPFSFQIALSGPSASPVTVDYATVDGTAAAPGDYVSASGTVSFAPGQTAKLVAVDVVGDATDEPDETFEVHLSGAAGATIADAAGTGTIRNDDGAAPPPAPCIAVSPATAVEFGTGMLAAPGAPVSIKGDKQISVTNCGATTETILVHATNATGSAASWELTDGDPCAAGKNRFGLSLAISEVSLRVAAADRILVTLGPGQAVTRNVRILMACSGSDGAGQTLTLRLVFTATT
jgi:Calx-beta domain